MMKALRMHRQVKRMMLMMIMFAFAAVAIIVVTRLTTLMDTSMCVGSVVGVGGTGAWWHGVCVDFRESMSVIAAEADDENDPKSQARMHYLLCYRRLYRYLTYHCMCYCYYKRSSPNIHSH